MGVIGNARTYRPCFFLLGFQTRSCRFCRSMPVQRSVRDWDAILQHESDGEEEPKISLDKLVGDLTSQHVQVASAIDPTLLSKNSLP